MAAEGLIKSTLSLIEEIEATVECLVSQREALASGRLPDIQGLLQNVRHVAVKAQEAERDRHLKAVALAKQLRCDPSAQAIASRLPEDEAASLTNAAKRLDIAVRKLRSELEIYGRLLEESCTLGELLISRWREIGNGFGGLRGGFEVRG